MRHKVYAPWRQESTPSVHIYDDGKWWDYGAGIGGDVLDFVGYCLYGLGYDPSIHLMEVVDKLGALDIKPLPAQPKRTAPEKPKLTLSLETIQHWHTTMPDERRAYWHSRGIIDTYIDKFQLGWDGKRYTIPLLYRNIPFGVKRRQSDIDDGYDTKYVMAKGSRPGLYNADVLWETDSIVVCEGEIDCILLNQYGFPAITTTNGAGYWKPEWAQLFSHVKKIWLLYDNDDAGAQGAQKAQATLRRAKIAHLPAGIKDIGELFDKENFPCKILDGILV